MTFQVIQGYAKTIQAFVDQITPIVVTLSPADAAQINSIKAQVDAAVAVFVALPADTASAKTTAQTIYQLTSAAIKIAEALPLPADAKAVLTAVQILLIVVGNFAGFPAAAAAGPPSASLSAARSIYDPASDKAAQAEIADAKVKEWLSTQPAARTP